MGGHAWRVGLAARTRHVSKSTVRYAIYTRQSLSDSDKTFSSCEAQFAICQDFVKAQASRRWKWIGERFDDVGVSGANANRPALQRLMQCVRSGRVDKVVIYRLDRLTRSLRDSIDVFDALRQAEVELLIVTAPELGSAATDRFLLNMMAAFAEFERDMIRSRLADARAALKRHGRRLAGRVPYGYDTDPHTKQFVVNFDEAQRVEAMFQLAFDGMRPSDIAAEANKLGWRTKRTVARRSGKVSGGGPWTPRQVLSLLTNPVYLGLFADGHRTRPGRHEPIVPRELWEQVQDQVKARRTSKHSRRSRSGARPWPLRGKILCPRCGRVMSTHETHDKPFIYRHYRCRSHAGGRPPCKGSALPAYAIETGVAEILADPAVAKGIADATRGDRRRLRRFQTAWALLDLQTQRRLLPEIIEQVVFDESDSKLQVRLNMDAVGRIIKQGNGLRDPGKPRVSARC